MLLADDGGLQNAGAGFERVHGRINALLGNLAAEYRRRVQMREGGRGRGVGQVVGRHIDCLHRGDRAVFRGGDRSNRCMHQTFGTLVQFGVQLYERHLFFFYYRRIKLFLILLHDSFRNITDTIDQVERVKRSENGVINDPIFLSKNHYVYDALEVMSKYRISGVPITDDSGKLIGILTNRDIRFLSTYDTKIEDVMTKDNLVTGKVGTTLDEAKKILMAHKIEKLPLVDDEGYLKGLIDLIITSPPYNLKNSSGNGMKDGRGGKWKNASLINGYQEHTDDMPYGEYCKWQRTCLRQMFRLIN